jgi:hypothetical protein
MKNIFNGYLNLDYRLGLKPVTDNSKWISFQISQELFLCDLFL